MKLTSDIGLFPDLHPDRRARREGYRLREVAEWPVPVGDTQAGDVQDRLALKLPPRPFVAKRI
jgi:hypothetical protein